MSSKIDLDELERKRKPFGEVPAEIRFGGDGDGFTLAMKGNGGLICENWPASPDKENEKAAYIVALWNAAPALIRELRSLRAEQQWVPVGERLPESPGNYLLVRGGKVWPGRFRDLIYHTRKARGKWEVSWGVVDDVTHWRPLPKGPEHE